MPTSNKEILEAVNRVADHVARVDEKADRTNTRLDGIAVRMDSLVETTNHRLDAFTAALDGKLDNGELLTSLGFKLMNHKTVRWAAGLIATVVIGTAAYQHWASFFEGLFGR